MAKDMVLIDGEWYVKAESSIDIGDLSEYKGVIYEDQGIFLDLIVTKHKGKYLMEEPMLKFTDKVRYNNDPELWDNPIYMKSIINGDEDKKEKIIKRHGEKTYMKIYNFLKHTKSLGYFTKEEGKELIKEV